MLAQPLLLRLWFVNRDANTAKQSLPSYYVFDMQDRRDRITIYAIFGVVQYYILEALLSYWERGLNNLI